jgi:hypothetical protein
MGKLKKKKKKNEGLLWGIYRGEIEEDKGEIICHMSNVRHDPRTFMYYCECSSYNLSYTPKKWDAPLAHSTPHHRMFMMRKTIVLDQSLVFSTNIRSKQRSQKS